MWLAHAFAVKQEGASFGVEDHRLIEKLAAFIVRRGMTTPAIMALETGRPWNFIGSQALVFLAPFLTLVFPPGEYERFTKILEQRGSIDLIVEKILELDAKQGTSSETT